MLTHIVPCNMWQAGREMIARRIFRHLSQRMAVRQTCRDLTPAPRTGKVQPVQVRNLAV